MQTLFSFSHHKKYVAALAVLVGIAIIIAFVYPRRESPQQFVTGVALLTLGGQTRTTGVHVRDGMRLGIDDINNSLALGEKTLTVFTEDIDSFDSPEEAFDVVMERYDPDFVVTMLSGISVRLKEKADQYQVPLLSTVAAAPSVTQSTDWTYRYWVLADDYVNVMRNHIAREGVDSMLMLYFDDEYGQSLATAMRSETGSSLGRLVQRPYSFGDDLFASIEDLDEFDALYVVGFEPALLGFVQTFFSEINYDGILLTTASLYNPVTRRTLPDNAQILEAAPVIYDTTRSDAGSVQQAFERRFGYPMGVDAATSYDFMQILARAIEGQRTVDRLSIKEAFDAGFPHTGILGTLNIRPLIPNIAHELFPVIIEGASLQYIYNEL
jgi:ABC-type branched-subunit amino acid transport system substrate-binding protein